MPLARLSQRGDTAPLLDTSIARLAFTRRPSTKRLFKRTQFTPLLIGLTLVRTAGKDELLVPPLHFKLGKRMGRNVRLRKPL